MISKYEADSRVIFLVFALFLYAAKRLYPSVTQTPCVHYAILISQLRKVRLTADFSEVTQLELKCRLSNPTVRARSTLLLHLTCVCFLCASVNALLGLSGFCLSLRVSSVFSEALGGPFREEQSPHSPLHSVTGCGACPGAAACSQVCVLPAGPEIGHI